MFWNATQEVSEVNNPWIQLPYTIIQYIVLILSILGNSLLIITLVRIRKLKKFVDKLIFNLGACNLLMVVVSIPADILLRASNNFPFGLFGCKIINPVSTYAVNTGVFTLMVIAFERWKVVAQPFGLVNKGLRAALIIVTIHGCGLGSIIPYMFTLRLKLKEGKIICEEGWSNDSARVYTVVLFAVQYAVPVPIMLGFYTKAWLIVQNMNITIVKPHSAPSEVSIRNERSSISIFSKCRLNHASVLYKIQENLMNKKMEKLYHLPIPPVQKRNSDTLSKSKGSNLFVHDLASFRNSFQSNKDYMLQCKIIDPKKAIYFPNNIESQFSNKMSNEKNDENIRRFSLGYPKFAKLSLRRFSLNDKDFFKEKKNPLKMQNDVSNFKQNTKSRSNQVLSSCIFPNILIEPSALQHKALQQRFRQSRDLLKTFTVVVTVFVIFMLPNQIYWMTLYFSHISQNECAVNIVYILTYANCVLNPWIYGGLNRTFRKDFKYLLLRISILLKLRKT
ncbi:uncharacterized protein LOC100213349 [Hydra vulgaris]|uniref:Uncharacterized protein LOC100213349 n=1 Tax=Hydra vulgaris TaxID=6087 RepID=A0ABM4BXY5_HYDVU